MENEYHKRLAPDGAKTPEQAVNKIKNANIEHIYIFARGRQICRFIGEVDRVKLEPNNLFELNDAILVHNHPSGTSFSREDVEMIIAHDAKQLIVVTADFLYTISRPSTGWPVELDEQMIHVRFEDCKQMAEEMADKLISQHQVRSSEKDATIIHYIWKLFFHETSVLYVKKKLES